MFNATQNKGFQLTFKNGLTLSVQWGPANYCEKRSLAPDSFNFPYQTDNGCWESPDAEVMVWDADHKAVTKDFFPELENDDVVGHLSPEDVATLVHEVARA